jgi:hypothetical protein
MPSNRISRHLWSEPTPEPSQTMAIQGFVAYACVVVPMAPVGVFAQWDWRHEVFVAAYEAARASRVAESDYCNRLFLNWN